MSIFGNIARAIFGTSSTPGTTAATGTSAAPSAPTAPGSSPAAPSASTAPGSSPAARTATAGSPAATTAAQAVKPISMGEVETMIKNIADTQSEKLNWKQSIVDLMKLLKLDSSLSARKELAQELGYKGALDGSAEMNVWLHKQVMTKLAESGGKVPDSLRT
jgi:Domain of unknown function (DUF3597)